MEHVPSLPILGGQDTVERREVAEATCQTVGQLFATGATGVADWLWPQSEPSSTRLTYVSVGNGFPPLSKRLVKRIQALEFVDMAELRPAQWQEVLEPEPDPRRCDSAWPRGSKGEMEVGGGYQNLDDVLHHLCGCSGEEAP